MEQINTFWNWFRDNQQEILNLTNESDQVFTHHLYWLNELLTNYCSALELFLILPTADRQKPELIITTKDPVHYHSVSALVEHAPRLPKWKIVSLQLPATSEDFLDNVMLDVTLKTEGSTVVHEPNMNSIFVIRLRTYTIICNMGCADDAIAYCAHSILRWPLHNELSFVQVKDGERMAGSLFRYYEMCFYVDTVNFRKSLI